MTRKEEPCIVLILSDKMLQASIGDILTYEVMAGIRELLVPPSDVVKQQCLHPRLLTGAPATLHISVQREQVPAEDEEAPPKFWTRINLRLSFDDDAQ